MEAEYRISMNPFVLQHRATKLNSDITTEEQTQCLIAIAALFSRIKEQSKILNYNYFV